MEICHMIIPPTMEFSQSFLYNKIILANNSSKMESTQKVFFHIVIYSNINFTTMEFIWT